MQIPDQYIGKIINLISIHGLPKRDFLYFSTFKAILVNEWLFTPESVTLIFIFLFRKIRFA